MATHSIGAINFQDMRGGKDLAGQSLEIVIRRGRHGAAFWRMGNHPKPFQLFTIEDVLNMTVAKTQFVAYKALQGLNPQTVIHNGQTLDQTCMVIHVKESRSPKQLANAVGGLVAGNVLLFATWVLIPIDN